MGGGAIICSRWKNWGPGQKVRRPRPPAPAYPPLTVSYLPSVVTMVVSLAISELFNVKEWRGLENWDRGCSRSLIVAPFD